MADAPHTPATHKTPKAPPPRVNTPEERRKFVILVGMAGAVVLLIWIATLPWNLKQNGPGAPGPSTVFGVIAQQLSSASRIGDIFHNVKAAQESQ